MKTRLTSIELFLFVLVIIFASNVSAGEYPIASNFKFPVSNYLEKIGANQFGICGLVYSCPIRHLGDDVSVSAGTKVFAPADGLIKKAYKSSSYGGVYLIEHNLGSEKVVSLLAHLDYSSFQKESGIVSKGEYLAEIGTREQNGNWPEHLHYEIRKGAYVSTSQYYYCHENGRWIWRWPYIGYSKNANLTKTKKTEYDVTHKDMVSHFYDPSLFTLGVAQFCDGFHDDGTSQAFLEAYRKHKDIIGHPYDNGGGVFVHEWKSPTDPSYSVWIQDFYNPETDKHYALVLNDLETPKKAYLLQGAIRNFYMNHDGPYNYGVPFTGEISGKLANSHLTAASDFVRPSSFDHPDSQVEPKQIIVQKFKQRVNGEYNNERRTIVHDPETGETRHFPLGQFSLQSISADGSDHQLYLYNYGGNDIPWPVDGCTVPTGSWFLKPGDYNFVLHNPDGSQRYGWGLTVPITEGNDQYAGESGNYAFHRASICEAVNDNMPEGKTYSFYPKDGYVGFWFELTEVQDPLDVTMKWYRPGGDLFGVCDIVTREPTGESWKKVRFWRFLEVSGLEEYGVWKVELYVDGRKINTQRFSLSEYGTGSSYNEPIEVPEPPKNLQITSQ